VRRIAIRLQRPRILNSTTVFGGDRSSYSTSRVRHRTDRRLTRDQPLIGVFCHVDAATSDMFYVAGPGHGGPAIVGNTYLEGTYSEVYPDVSRDRANLKRLFKQFSFPGGISSHVAPTTPESIYEGGELSSLLSLGIKRPLTTIESGGTCGHRGRANGS
jgi:hypothetical protein